MKTALIIIDVQNILVETGFQSDIMMDKISFLQHQARSKGVELSIFSILKIQKTVYWKTGSCLLS